MPEPAYKCSGQRQGVAKSSSHWPGAASYSTQGATWRQGTRSAYSARAAGSPLSHQQKRRLRRDKFYREAKYRNPSGAERGHGSYEMPVDAASRPASDDEYQSLSSTLSADSEFTNSCHDPIESSHTDGAALSSQFRLSAAAAEFIPNIQGEWLPIHRDFPACPSETHVYAPPFGCTWEAPLPYSCVDTSQEVSHMLTQSLVFAHALIIQQNNTIAILGGILKDSHGIDIASCPDLPDMVNATHAIRKLIEKVQECTEVHQAVHSSCNVEDSAPVMEFDTSASLPLRIPTDGDFLEDPLPDLSIFTTFLTWRAHSRCRRLFRLARGPCDQLSKEIECHYENPPISKKLARRFDCAAEELLGPLEEIARTHFAQQLAPFKPQHLLQQVAYDDQANGRPYRQDDLSLHRFW